MRRATSILTALALLLGLGASAQAQESYVRFTKGDGQRDAALQTAVAHFRHPSKDVEIILYGVVHIADLDYYGRVQRDLDSYSTVLYEGVAPGKTAPTEEDKSLGEMQMMMGDMLGLTFQKDGIDYTRSNLVHADMNMDQLKERLGGDTINPMGNVMGKDQMKKMMPMMKMFGQMGKALMANNPQMQDQFKLMMGSQMAGSKLEQGLGQKMTEVILVDRNKVVMEVLARQLEQQKSGTIAIFYGAAHHVDFEQRLTALGYERVSKRWMTAWKIGNGVGEDEAPVPSNGTSRPEPVPAAPEGPRWF